MASACAFREYAKAYREHSLTQQISYGAPVGIAAGQPPCGQAYQHQRPEALFCDRRRVGTLAAAAVPAAQDSFPPGARALSLGPGAASFGNAAGAGGADRQHPIFSDRRRRPQGSSLGLGACAARSAAVRRRQPALFHARKRPAGFAGSGPPAGPSKRAPLDPRRTPPVARIAGAAPGWRLGYT